LHKKTVGSGSLLAASAEAECSERSAKAPIVYCDWRHQEATPTWRISLTLIEYGYRSIAAKKQMGPIRNANTRLA
jgi:hypothetical protein